MVSVERPVLDLKQVARAYRAVEPLHNHVYFAPETEQQLTAVGLRPGRMCYFAGRAAPMGAVGPGVVAATFYNFSPTLIARHIPLAWTLASPADVLAARLAAARASLTRLLGGPEEAAAPEVQELAGLLREACSVLTPEGRPLFAGHADLPWPDEPLLQVWHAASLLREYRGDGHLTTLLLADLSGLEALISHTATGRGFTEQAAKIGRGYSEDEWAAGCASLADRGLLDDGRLTAAGEELRGRLEAETDVLSADPWLFLGPERTARVVELGRGFSARLVANGAYPADTFSSR
jgi:hypothetical protein